MGADEENKSQKEFQTMLAVVDAPRRTMPEFSEERKKEMFQIGRRYSFEYVMGTVKVAAV